RFGLREPALVLKDAGKVVERGSHVRMPRTQESPLRIECPTNQFFGFVQPLALSPEHKSQVAERSEYEWMVLAQEFPPDDQRFAIQGVGLSELALITKQVGQVIE